MMVVGLTGGIGSGKSTVAKMFTAHGIPVYNSDLEAKRLMQSSGKVKAAILDLLGEGAYEGEKLNTSYIGKKVFGDRELLGRLNRIVHPAVKDHFLAWAKQQKAPYVIQEAAIIFENGSQHNYDRTILVKAPKELRIQRVMERDGSTRKEVLSRMRNQWEDSQKEKLAHFVLENEQLGKTERQVAQIHSLILKESRQWGKF
jgi:dephospho-CoA kinase